MNTVIRLLWGAVATLALTIICASPANSGSQPTEAQGNFYGTASLNVSQVIKPAAPELVCYDLSDDTDWTCWEPQYDPYRNKGMLDGAPGPVWSGSTKDLNNLNPDRIPQQ